MKKIVLSAILALLSVTVAAQAKNMDKETLKDIKEAVMDQAKDLPIKLMEDVTVEQVDFNETNGTMTTYIALHKKFDDRQINSKEFKELIERETKNLKAEACSLEIAQELKQFDDFKVAYVYYENSLRGKIVAQVKVIPAIDCK